MNETDAEHAATRRAIMLGTVFGILMMLFVGVVIAKQGSSSFFAQLMWADANDVLHMRWHPQ